MFRPLTKKSARRRRFDLAARRKSRSTSWPRSAGNRSKQLSWRLSSATPAKRTSRLFWRTNSASRRRRAERRSRTTTCETVLCSCQGQAVPCRSLRQKGGRRGTRTTNIQSAQGEHVNHTKTETKGKIFFCLIREVCMITHFF